MAREKTCSKCEKRPATDTHPWCRECKTENEQRNRRVKLTLARAQGFKEGVEAEIQTLAQEFARHGGGLITCAEVSQAILRSPRAQFVR
jgi:hypothetical protein